MNNIKENILDKIKDGKISQTSRFYFVTRDYVFYALTFIATILGSIAVSSILFQSITEHLVPLRKISTGRDLWISFLQTAPYVWIVVFVVLVLIAWFNFKHTKRAYKKHNILIVSAVLLFSCLGGYALFLTGYSEIIERSVRKNLPQYNSEIERRHMMRDNFIQTKRGAKIPNIGEGRYIAPPHRCPLIEYTCPVGEEKFKDRNGCGCKPIQ